MKQVLLLGATGRTGVFILEQLAADQSMNITAALRKKEDIIRLPNTKHPIQTSIIDIEDISSLRRTASEMNIIINAIRLRGNIPEMALVKLDKRIRKAAKAKAHIITVGGAGSLKKPNGEQFWQNAHFPERTLPRGIAHTRLRGYLETCASTESWAYLIPPPAYYPNGPKSGCYHQWEASNNEVDFLNKQISYQDFATAVYDAVKGCWTGVHLIAGTSVCPRSSQ